MSASEIRYAVIGGFSYAERCGMIAVGRDHLGREPYPVGGRVRRVTMRAAAGMFAHAGDGGVVRTAARLRRPCGGVWGCSVDVRPPSDSGIPKAKARGGWLRAGLRSSMMTSCDLSTKEAWSAGVPPPHLALQLLLAEARDNEVQEISKPATVSGAGFTVIAWSLYAPDLPDTSSAKVFDSSRYNHGLIVSNLPVPH